MMGNNHEPVNFIVHHDGETRTISTYKNEYNSLMELLSDKLYAEGFGECGGMGRCATCMVSISQSVNALEGMERNEAATLVKMGISEPNVRLSCQIVVGEGLSGAEVTVL